MADYEKRGYSIYVEYGLLTPAEFEHLASLPDKAPQIKSEMVTFPGPLGAGGTSKSFYLISLMGLDMAAICSMRRIKFYTHMGLEHKEMLLLAARQLSQTQGKTLFQFNNERQAENLPKQIKEDNNVFRSVWLHVEENQCCEVLGSMCFLGLPQCLFCEVREEQYQYCCSNFELACRSLRKPMIHGERLAL